VLQTSGCGEAEVVMFVVDKYHCIPLDGRVAFGVQVNVYGIYSTNMSASMRKTFTHMQN
jgi:hypothetical protein